MARVDVKLHRASRIYRPSEVVDGVVTITSLSGLSHQGIRLTALGSVIIQPSPKAVGVIESLYSSVKPMVILKKAMDLSGAGKLGIGKSELAFDFPLDVSQSSQGDGVVGVLYETYHGAYINIQYQVIVEVVRGYLQKPYTANFEFFVEGHRARLLSRPESVSFYITHDTQNHFLLPAIRSGGFKVTGKVATQCLVSEPLTGELTVEYSNTPLLSIDVLLFRVESILVSDRSSTERTEIQTTQIADGDVCRGVAIPIYVILPRLLTCPTLSANTFSVNFELCIKITFDTRPSAQLEADSKQLVAFETLPVRLLRS
ncbi:Down syndrome critical region protein 3 isoform X1 [Selaginella moellendorffii]|uniref:Down syndrome critical region protein 3 isoform X1 n=1 Tax=Selaginella moellendorffii TaxID=88036 RepID=UPI000D1CDF70|nr:Down syndrome critical region protein 3 isoform X1 [Selaginella moellendorffii]|eukprot:XP_024515356.1 Down syndrome critical region protein 3 isoform X1 [Selaginella moellendorffii]